MLARAMYAGLVSLILCLPLVVCHSMEDAKRLLTDKLNGYEKTFRPISNQSDTVVLYTAMELVSIQEFDEVQEKLTITAVIVLNWLDEYMRWDPDNYGGMTELVMESDKVWTPNLVLTNNVDKLEKVGDAWQVIRFSYEGVSFYYPGNVFSASCRVDVTYYPWDRHACHFSFSIWAHSVEEVAFWPSEKKVLTTYFAENGAWTFYDSGVEMLVDGHNLLFVLYLDRKPRFVFVNVILPIILMAFLNTMIFLIPVESGERISYSITVLLAIAVFLTLVGDNLPKTSSPMSIFSYYLLTILIVSICITLANILIVRLFYADDSDPVTGCLASFSRCMQCKCSSPRSRRNRKNRKKRDNDSSKTESGRIYENVRAGSYRSSANDGVFYTGKTTNRNHYHPEKALRTFNENDEECDTLEYGNHQMSDVSWKDVSAALDKIIFVLCLGILIIATFVLFLLLLSGDRR